MPTTPLGPPRGPPLGPPLAGVRVLDLSQVLAGPVCGRILADLGADVIKIEAPHGDRTREVLPHVNGQSLYYTHANAGKRGVGIDLRTDAGASLVGQLAEHADVFVENFRPGVLARRGLGADDLLERNPRLVYCSISGWGQHGPWANRQAYAPLIHAEAGRIELAARLRDELPRQEVHNHGDINAAMCATHAVLAALFQRERSGRGQHLDVSLAEALVYTDEWSSTDVYGYGRERFFDIWTHPVFVLADGTDVAMVGNPVRIWDQWLAALGDEPRPAPDNHDDALATLRALVAGVPDFPTLEAMLEPYPMLVGEVRSVADLAATPWAEARGLFVEVEPDTRVVSAPFRSRDADVGVRGPAPRAGEHTRAVLTELLGLDDATLDALQADGAIY
jgi:crotonobetainyl-CoA:carnitine CoA-transferase CaiB-like acyl-CoA transferase